MPGHQVKRQDVLPDFSQQELLRAKEYARAKASSAVSSICLVTFCVPAGDGTRPVFFRLNDMSTACTVQLPPPDYIALQTTEAPSNLFVYFRGGGRKSDDMTVSKSPA